MADDYGEAGAVMTTDDELIEEMLVAYYSDDAPIVAVDAMRAALAVVRAHDRDGERWCTLLRLATQWPQTELVVNINIGHDWHTADTPKQIQDVVDAAMRAEG